MLKNILPLILLAAPAFSQSQLQIINGTGDFFGADVDVISTTGGDLPDVMIAGDFTDGSVSFFERDADNFDWQLVQTINSGAGVGFGLSVELEQSFLGTQYYAIVGAPDINPRAEVYVRNGFTGTWSLQGTILPPATVPANTFFGGSVDLDWNGPIPLAFVSDVNDNTVYIYSYDGLNWSLDDTVTSTMPQFGGRYGQEISYDDEFLIVGAPGESNSDGRAYFYRNAFSGWLLENVIDFDGSPQLANFGISVDVENDVACIGAYDFDGEGRAYVIRKSFPQGFPVWNIEDELVGSDTKNGDNFGLRVDVAINRIVVGAPQAEDAIFDPQYDHGAAYVFSVDGGVWSEDYRVVGPQSIIPNETNDDVFGYGATIDGQFLMVGRPRRSGTDGKVDVFALNNLIRSQSTIDKIAGGSQALLGTFDLADLGDTYFLVGSLSPGLALDSYTNFTLANPNSAFFTNSLGILNSTTVLSSINIPAGVNFTGTLYHGFRS